MIDNLIDTNEIAKKQPNATNKAEKKRPNQDIRKTWTLEEIRSEGGFVDFRGFDILTSAAFGALRRNDKSRKGITCKTRLTAEDVAETVKEFRERLEGTEEDMECFLEDNREASDKILKLIAEE